MLIAVLAGLEPVLNIRLVLLPLIVASEAPGPVITSCPFIGISPVVNVINCGELNSELNVTVSAPEAAFASNTACLSDPAPLSFVFVTVKTDGITCDSNRIKRGRK
jgi:hypothetical protein